MNKLKRIFALWLAVAVMLPAFSAAAEQGDAAVEIAEEFVEEAEAEQISGAEEFAEAPEEAVGDPAAADEAPEEEPRSDGSAFTEEPLAAEDAGEAWPVVAEEEFRIVNPIEALGVKESYTLKAAPEGEGDVWTSDNEKIVKIVDPATGEIKGMKKGTTTVTVRSAEGRAASILIKVLSAPSKISLSAKKGTQGVHESVQLTAKLPKNTASQSITWTSSAPGIATVEDGLVTGVSEGKAKITVQTFNKKKASYTVTVKGEPEDLYAPEFLALSKGQKYTLSVALNPSTAAGKMRITSTNEAVLKLDKSELVPTGKATIKLTAQAEGSTTLRFEMYNGLATECEVRVCAAPTKLTIANAVASLGVGEEYQLRAECDTDPALLMHAKWKSSNKKIIAVDAKTGKLEAKKKGTATISVTIPKGKKTIKKSAKIKVLGAATGIALDRTSASLKEGQTLQLTAELPKKTASRIGWESDDERVATVEDGLVTAVGGGEATITARTYNGYSASCVVTVEGERPPVVNPPKAPSIRINGTAAGSEAVEVSGDVALTWSSAEAVDSYAVRVEDESGAAVLDEPATTETSATIPAASLCYGESYTVRVAATRNGQTGEAAVARFRYVQPGPLSIASVQADRESAQTGDPVVWTANVTGGAQPLTYAWEVRCGEELEYSGTSVGPELVYAPRSSGSYTAKLTATDASGAAAEATSAPLTVSARPASPIQDFTFNVLDDTHCEITGYTGSDTVLILPETDGQGHVVQKIGDGAFEFNESLRSVVLSSGIETIGESAFFYCSQLRDVSLPEGLLTIQYCAFSYCALEQIHIPDSVTTMGERAIYCCDKLREANYPKNLVSLDTDMRTGLGTPFCDCPLLKHMIVPEGVTEIPSYAFAGMSSLESIELPGTLETCGMNAFSETSLTEIELPENMLKIGDYAFEDCELLKNVIIPDKVTEIGSLAFSRCKSLTHVSLSEGLQVIRGRAFEECTALEQIHIPDSVTELGSHAFFNCQNLRQVNYPKGLETVSDGARTPFYLCPLLRSIVVPEGVTEIPQSAFHGMDSLESIKLPETLKTIGINAFADCFALTEIELPQALETISHMAFSECRALRAVRIGSGVNNIFMNPFSGCDPAKLTFYGEAGSYAEIWAEENGYNFSTEEFPSTRVKLSGRVVTRDGQPIPGVTVTIWEDASTDSTPVTVSTGEDGAWSYDGAKAAHEYRIEFEKEGYNFPDTPLLVIAGSADTPVQDVIGEQGPVTVSVLIEVLSPFGTGVSNAMIQAKDIDTGIVEGTAVTDAGGKATISGLQQGETYLFECTDRNFIYENILKNISGADVIVSFTAETPSYDYVLAEPGDYSASQAGETVDVQILSSADWTAQSKADWLTLDVGSGQAKDFIHVSVSENPGNFRTGEIVLSSSNVTYSLYIRQPGALGSHLGTPTITSPATDGESVPFGSINVAWEAVEGADSYVVSLRDLETDALLIHHQATTNATSAVLSAEYFSDGHDYRVAVGAVPPGTPSSDPSVGWCERIFTIPEYEDTEEVVFTGTVYELQAPEQISIARSIMNDNSLDGNAKAAKVAEAMAGEVHVKIDMLENVRVSYYHLNVQDGNTWELINSVLTNGNGEWRVNGLKAGEQYSFVFSRDGYIFSGGVAVERLTYTALPGENQVISVYGYSEDINDLVQAYLKLNGYQTTNMKNGLLAEYFVYEKNRNWSEMTSIPANKRNEGIVDNIDFTWTEENVGGWMQSINYYRLKAAKFTNPGSAIGYINYVPLKFAARFNGYLKLKGAPDENTMAKYKFRVRGDDGVCISMQLSETETAKSKDDWRNRGLKETLAELGFTDMGYLNGTVFKLDIWYYNSGRDAKLVFEYSMDEGKTWQTVPKDWLYNDGKRYVSIMEGDTNVGVDYVSRLAESNEALQNYGDKLLSQFLTDQANNIVDGVVGAYNTVHVLYGDHQLKQMERIRLFWLQRAGKKAAQAAYSALFDGVCGLREEASIWDAIRTRLLYKFGDEFNFDTVYDGTNTVVDSIATLREFCAVLRENGNTVPAIRSLQQSILGEIDRYTTGEMKGMDFSVDAAFDAFHEAGKQERTNLASEIFQLDPALNLIWETATKGMALVDRLHGDDANTNRAILTLMFAETGEKPHLVEAAGSMGDLESGVAILMHDFDRLIGQPSNISRDDYESDLNKTSDKTMDSIGARLQGVNIQELLYKDLLKITLDTTYSFYSQGLWK